LESQDWNFVKKVFNDALEISADIREEFVRKETKDKPDLFQTIIDMLDSEAAKDANITQMISSNIKQLVSDKFEVKPGEKIGVYELDSVIGEGGMGTVFKAKRVDAEFDSKVAIKVIHRQCLNSETLKRFKSERQILANLNHPNIARLIDGGTTDSGLPYLVMEYIEGKTLIDYCKEKRIGFKSRIKLFMQVCKAVNYAHQNLIVHRDIKPANILVTSDGQIKLLDFGVAKILNPDEYSKSVAETQIEMRILTLENAAPEQVLGEKITTRTDVYALGTLLFQLLTEEKIFNLKEQYRKTFEKAICEQMPTKPSKVISNTNSLVNVKIPEGHFLTLNAAKNKLKGDLDNIILKSLQKEPERRYQSVEQFYNDIDRYLNYYPVKAQPDQFLYLTKKFIQRHKLGVLFSSISVVFIIFFVGLLSVQNHTIKNQIEMIKEQTAIANMEAESAKQVSEYMLEIFSSSDPNENAGKDITALELLNKGKAKINKLETPKVKARLLETLARIYQKLGSYQEATSLIEQSLEIYINTSDTTDLEMARVYYRLGEIQYELGEYDNAIQILDRSTKFYDTSDLLDEYERTSPLIVRAIIYSEQQKYKKAKDLDEKILELVLRKFTKKSREAGEAYTNLGAVLRHLGDLAGSEKMIRAGLAARISSLGNISLETGHSYNQLASTLSLQGKNKEAIEPALKGLKIRRSIYKTDHAEIAASLGNLAKIYSKLDMLDESETARRESIEILKRLFGYDHAYVAGSLSSLGLLLINKKDYENAERVFREALQIFQNTFSKDSPRLAYPLTGLGKLYIKQGNMSKALPLLLDAYQLREKGLPEDHVLTATTARFLGEALILTGNVERGNMYLNNALNIFEQQFGVNDSRTSEIRRLLEAKHN